MSFQFNVCDSTTKKLLGLLGQDVYISFRNPGINNEWEQHKGKLTLNVVMNEKNVITQRLFGSTAPFLHGFHFKAIHASVFENDNSCNTPVIMCYNMEQN